MPADTSQPPWQVHLTDGMGASDVDLLRDGTLPGRWTRLWRESPAAPQVRDVDGTWLSRADLDERSAAVARRLLGAGLERGDRCILSAATSAAMVIAYIGALRAGLVIVPVNTAYTRAEVERIVASAEPRVAIVDGDDRAAWIREAAPDAVVTGVAVDLPDVSGGEIDVVEADDQALLVFTSGTTGRPKGVGLTQANLLASATAVALAWRWTADDRLLLTLPLFHMHGLGVGINGSLSIGSSIVLRPTFDVDDVAATCADGDITMFFGVPAMYQRLAAAGAASALRSLRLVVSGSAPLPPTLAAAIQEQAGQVPLERYGMTETVMLTTNPYAGPRRPGSVGFPFPGVELRLGDGAEIEVRGPNVITRYAGDTEANDTAFTDDGWFRTGDLGEFDEDGYLHLVGRSKDLIITGGYNVHPREVEEVLLTHPAVAEVAVVGRASEQWGEMVVAVVVPEGDEVDPAVLRTHAADRLTAYKVPKVIEFVTELPRNALGKVVRADLP